MRPKLAAGAAAAVLALTASAGAAASPGGTDAVPVAARHAPIDTRFTELRALAQVKRDVAWGAVQRARAGQPQTSTSRFTGQRALAQVKPQTGTSRFTDQRALAQVKRHVSWNAVQPAAGGA